MALLVSRPSGAAGWEIDPVRVELSPEQQTAAITLKNSSDQPILDSDSSHHMVTNRRQRYQLTHKRSARLAPHCHHPRKK